MLVACFWDGKCQMLLDELDHFRGEIAEMVEMERGLLRQTLERESESVQRQVKDLLVSSKGDIVNILKLDVQKWLQSTHENVFLMTEALKQDLDTLKNELGRTQVHSSFRSMEGRKPGSFRPYTLCLGRLSC